jgi:protein-tyrosine-phosphatase
MTANPLKVLVLCTGNSARSIIGEYLLRATSLGRIQAFSADANPTGKVNPLAIWILKDRFGIDAADVRSKSWDEFKNVPMDCVIAVCDNARESCPVCPGQPVLAHWGTPDPAAFDGPEEGKQRMFVDVALQIARRIDLMLALPSRHLDAFRLQEIGEQAKLENESFLPR